MENGVVLIATASASTSSGSRAIRLWQWRSKENREEEVAGEEWTFCEAIGLLMKLVVVLAAVAHVVGLVKQAVCKLYLPPFCS
jgi:hypothetical protein